MLKNLKNLKNEVENILREKNLLGLFLTGTNITS